MQNLHSINTLHIENNRVIFDDIEDTNQADDSVYTDCQDFTESEHELEQGLKCDSGRAMRRFQKYRNRHKSHTKTDLFKPEKNWKHMYGRRNKILRARQLGKEYPPRNIRQVLFELDSYKIDGVHTSMQKG